MALTFASLMLNIEIPSVLPQPAIKTKIRVI